MSRSKDLFLLDKNNELSQCLFCSKLLYYCRLDLEDGETFCDSAWCDHGEFDIEYSIYDEQHHQPYNKFIVIPLINLKEIKDCCYTDNHKKWEDPKNYFTIQVHNKKIYFDNDVILENSDIKNTSLIELIEKVKTLILFS